MRKLIAAVRQIVDNRALWTFIVIALIFGLLIRDLYALQILNASDFKEKVYKDQTEEYATSGVRGNIYDCYGRELAVNTTSLSLFYKPETSGADLNAVIGNLLDIFQKNGEELAIADVLPIQYDDYSGFYFTERFANPQGTARLNFLAEIYGTKRADLTDEQKNASAEEAFLRMRDETFGIDPELPMQRILQLMEIRYVFFQGRWTPEKPILVARNVSEKTEAIIVEQSDIYKGFYVERVYARSYPQGEYFSHIVGYVGRINETELEELQDSGYTENDVIGKMGLELTYEEQLRGDTGKVEVTYSGRTGEKLSEKTLVAAGRGKDLILTIDADFQKECYNILYKHIKELLLEKISGTSGDNNTQYSDMDVVSALVRNGFIDTEVIQESDLPDAVRYTQAYNQEADAALARLRKLILNSTTLITNYSDEQIDYFSLVVSYLREQKYLSTDYRDDTNHTYVNYVSGLTTAREFLEYCYKGGYFNLEEFGLTVFSDTAEGLSTIVDTALTALRHNYDYEQLVYTNVLKKDLFDIEDFIELCYDLRFFNDEDGYLEDYKDGDMTLLTLLRSKIWSDEITPSDLNLDPCSGSMVVSDVNSGEIRAIVSYPSYDTNRFLNSQKYYRRTVRNQSSPMLFRAVQETRAPGSTFKMCTSAAGLELGYIDTNYFIYDAYAYENVNSVAKPTCWSQISHGTINVIGALEVSCNYFFYNVGYLLSDPAPDGSFDDQVGLEKLKRFAITLGLGTKTGIEVPEATPLISDTDAVRSAIGQGSHGYTVANINRYTNTIANGGDVYDLYLVDHLRGADGEELEKKNPKPVSHAAVSQENLDIIKQGMRLVNTETSKKELEILDIMGMETAGKTGTAEESYLHPEHAWYTGYTNYEDPEVSISIVIPYGNGSDKALPIFRDTVEAYYMLVEPIISEE